MKSYLQCGVTQKIISRLADVNQSTLSRMMTFKEFEPMQIAGKKTLRYSILDTRKILQELFQKKIKIKKKVHTFYNFKGGTGKTSLCFQTVNHLAICGFKVLVIDADPQGHLSTLMGFDGSENFKTLYDGLVENVSLDEIIVPVFEGLDCIPANLSLTRISLPLEQRENKKNIINEYISTLKDKYDFIVFDTNPTIGVLNRSIISCTELLNIVCETQPLSMNGLKLLLEDLSKYNEIMNLHMPEIFIIPNKYEDKSGSSAESMTVLLHYYSQYIEPDFAIRKSEDINSSCKLGSALSFFARNNSNALADIIQLLHIIVNKSKEN